ncbi:MAG: hypothetical protein ACTSYA_09625 [Candidatus Kariarchaeaceae archaeon]
MEPNSFKTEFIWFSGVLTLFFALLIITGSPDIIEMVIALSAFSFTWGIISYLIKRYGVGELDSDSLKKEVTWFIFLLFTFLGSLVLFASPKFIDLLIAGAAFSFIWLIRSILVRKFTSSENNGMES